MCRRPRSVTPRRDFGSRHREAESRTRAVEFRNMFNEAALSPQRALGCVVTRGLKMERCHLRGASLLWPRLQVLSRASKPHRRTARPNPSLNTRPHTAWHLALEAAFVHHRPRGQGATPRGSR